MDQERVTRQTVPTVSVTMPLSLKRWLDGEAKRRGMSRSALVADILGAERERCERAMPARREQVA